MGNLYLSKKREYLPKSRLEHLFGDMCEKFLQKYPQYCVQYNTPLKELGINRESTCLLKHRCGFDEFVSSRLHSNNYDRTNINKIALKPVNIKDLCVDALVYNKDTNEIVGFFEINGPHHYDAENMIQIYRDFLKTDTLSDYGYSINEVICVEDLNVKENINKALMKLPLE